MKVVFLDFDGVLNSLQEVIFKKNRQKTSWYWRNREKFANWVIGLSYGKRKDGTWKVKKDNWWRRWSREISHEYISDHGEFCPIACSNIQYILDNNPDVMIVVSSTWRTRGTKRLKGILKRNRIDPARVIDITPRGHEGPKGEVWVSEDIYQTPPPEIKLGRGTQIQKWLNHWNGEKVTHFAIVDDDGDMVHLKNKLIQTSSDTGFMWPETLKVIKLLEGSGHGSSN